MVDGQWVHRAGRVVHLESVAVPQQFPVAEAGQAGASVEAVRFGQVTGEGGDERNDLALAELRSSGRQAQRQRDAGRIGRHGRKPGGLEVGGGAGRVEASQEQERGQ